MSMQIIHASFKKVKAKKKSGWKQREEEYQAWLKSHGVTPKAKKTQTFETYTPPKTYHRETPNYPSLQCTGGICAKKENPVYTGNLIKGIGTMHKSNAVPIFSDEQAIEISKMRRG